MPHKWETDMLSGRFQIYIIARYHSVMFYSVATGEHEISLTYWLLHEEFNLTNLQVNFWFFNGTIWNRKDDHI